MYIVIKTKPINSVIAFWAIIVSKRSRELNMLELE